MRGRQDHRRARALQESGHHQQTATGGQRGQNARHAEERGTPLSPARLSERIALSNSATTALLNRLEHAGHIVRTREHDDRRVLTLRSSTEVQTLADEFFSPLGDRVDAVLAKYSPEQIQQFDTFLTDLRAAMTAQLDQPAAPKPG